MCESLERHRFLAYLLLGLQESLPVGPVLDVAPQPQLRRILTSLPGRVPYVGMDRFEPERRIDVIGDLTSAPLRSSAFAVIVCYHVLEHVPDDRSAMRELARVLAPDGVAFIQVPHRPNAPTDEDPTARVEERIRRFGQADHVRYYGRDFEERLAGAGFRCATLTPGHMLPDRHVKEMGLQAHETVWIARNSHQHRPTNLLPSALPDLETVRRRHRAIAAAKDGTNLPSVLLRLVRLPARLRSRWRS